VSTHAGRRLRVVDELGEGGVGWGRVFMGLGASGDDFALEVTSSGPGPIGGLARPNPSGTQIEFQLRIWPDALAPFVAPDARTHIQVVPWRQSEPDQGYGIEELSEDNLLFHMTSTPSSAPVVEETLWPLYVDLLPDLQNGEPPLGAVSGWGEDTLYWLTVRVCKTPLDSLTLLDASEPITIVTSMSFAQLLEYGPSWGYIAQFAPPGPLPALLLANNVGGGVVGVIERVVVPPPPPPNGIPSPRAGVTQAQTTNVAGPQ
jgi:hypothetical protein